MTQMTPAQSAPSDALGGPPVGAADLPARTVVQADWARKPSADDLGREYPPQAQAKGVEGRVVMDCTVALTGDLKDCRISSETPQGYGFGAAGLRLASQFRMQPSSVDGVMRESSVRIPLSFRLPHEAGPDFGMMLHVAAVMALALILVPLAAGLNDLLHRGAARTARIGAALERGFGLVGPAWRQAPMPLLAYGAAQAFVQFALPSGLMPGAADATARLHASLKFLPVLVPVLLIATLWAYGAAYRVALSPGRPGDFALRPRWLGLQVGRVEGRVFLAGLALFVLVLAAAAMLLLVGGVTIAMGQRWLGQEGGVLLVGLAPAMFALAGFLALVRLKTFMVAWVAEGHARLGESWRAMRASLLPLIVVEVVLAVVLGAGSMGLGGVGYLMLTAGGLGASKLGFALGYGVVGCFQVPIAVGVSTYFYETLQASPGEWATEPGWDAITPR